MLLSLDKTTGAVLWERIATEATPHEGFHPQYGSFASHSPVTDGEHVFAYFGSRGVYCYALDGRLIWNKDLGQMRRFLQFGEGTPIVLHDDRLIIKADHEGESFIVALDKATGNELWRAARDEVTSWSPPLVVDHEDRKQIVVAATRKVRSYDFATGEVIWEVAGLGRNQIPAPVHQNDLVFVMSGFIAPNLMAIRLGGHGDLADTDAADSIGRCNSLREYIRRRPVAERLAGPGVEFARNRIQLSLGVAGEVGPLRQILAQ